VTKAVPASPTKEDDVHPFVAALPPNSIAPGSAPPLPGTPQLQQLIDGFSTWALMAALAGMLLGAAVWALGHHSSNYQQAANGRKGVLVSGAAAMIIGAAPTLISFFTGLGSQVTVK
jgi:MFS family permease